MRIERIGDATLYLGDCRDMVGRDLALQADAVVADPPYGINLHALTGTGRENIVVRDRPLDVRIIGDDEPFDPAPWLGFAQAILWGGIHFAQRLPESSRCWLVWDKRDDSTSDNQADCEIAWTNLPGPARLFRHKWRGFARAGEENIINGPKLHPAQKPQSLMRWCVQMTSGIVLDPYMGSGTTGVACATLQRPFIGIEIEPKYFDIACERIENAQRQKRMFA